MSGGRLWQLATLLSVPIGYFFHGLAPCRASASPEAEGLETAALARTFAALPEGGRRRLLELLREMAGDPTPRQR